MRKLWETIIKILKSEIKSSKSNFITSCTMSMSTQHSDFKRFHPKLQSMFATYDGGWGWVGGSLCRKQECKSLKDVVSSCCSGVGCDYQPINLGSTVRKVQSRINSVPTLNFGQKPLWLKYASKQVVVHYSYNPLSICIKAHECTYIHRSTREKL
jgi:hypothetical protein